LCGCGKHESHNGFLKISTLCIVVIAANWCSKAWLNMLNLHWWHRYVFWLNVMIHNAYLCTYIRISEPKTFFFLISWVPTQVKVKVVAVEVKHCLKRNPLLQISVCKHMAHSLVLLGCANVEL
jgi:hypothetical protein